AASPSRGPAAPPGGGFLRRRGGEATRRAGDASVRDGGDRAFRTDARRRLSLRRLPVLLRGRRGAPPCDGPGLRRPRGRRGDRLDLHGRPDAPGLQVISPAVRRERPRRLRDRVPRAVAPAVFPPRHPGTGPPPPLARGSRGPPGAPRRGGARDRAGGPPEAGPAAGGSRDPGGRTPAPDDRRDPDRPRLARSRLEPARPDPLRRAGE